jgi:hypothetical protein
LSTVLKVFNTVLNTRIVTYLDGNNILSDEQNGFRRMRACIDHIYVLSTTIKYRKKSKKDTFACFIDFTKAFDSVDHTLLWLKCIRYGIDGKILKCLQVLYQNMESAVRVNASYTEWFRQIIGVRQGAILSPTLFNIFF